MADGTLSTTPKFEKVAPGAHAVVVMAKAPVSGAVKSRLVPPLTDDEAAALNRCFIRDVCGAIEAAAAIVAADGNARVPDGNADSLDRNARVVGMIAYTPAGTQAAFHGLVPPSFKFIAQRGDGLTARLTNVAADLFAEGYASVSLMNSDSPTIPPAFIAAAVTHLADALEGGVGQTCGDRLAIIGADDGGYCLIGLNRPHSRIFEEISWSTGAVLAQTLQRAAELRLIVLQTPSWYDVDDAGALRRLIIELSRESSSEVSGGPSRKLSKNARISENSSGVPVSNHSLERAVLSQGRQLSIQIQKQREQNEPNFFTPLATRAWLAEALAKGLADRLGLPPSEHSSGSAAPRSPRSR
jgi:rSAM/selenodomain-associated transferase 1